MVGIYEPEAQRGLKLAREVDVIYGVPVVSEATSIGDGMIGMNWALHDLMKSDTPRADREVRAKGVSTFQLEGEDPLRCALEVEYPEKSWLPSYVHVTWYHSGELDKGLSLTVESKRVLVGEEEAILALSFLERTLHRLQADDVVKI